MAPTPAWITRTRTSSLEIFSSALLHGLGGALDVSLDDDGQLLHIVGGHLVEQVIQGDLGVSGKLLFLGLGGTLVGQLTGQALVLNSARTARRLRALRSGR